MLGPEQLAFNFDVREWCEKQSYTLLHSGDDEKLVIKYASALQYALYSDEELDSIKLDIGASARLFALEHNVLIEINYGMSSDGEAVATITSRLTSSRAEAAEEFHQLVFLGPNMTREQHLRCEFLRKKYGFV